MIAKKHAQSYMPNGELSLEQVIQAAIDEAVAAYVNYPEYRDKNELQEHIRQLDFVIEQHKNHAIGLHERIRQLEAEQVPDMFWSAENPEEGGLHCSEIAENLADNLDHGESADFDILCAKKYPTQTMRVSVADDGKGVDWEWLAAAPAQEKV